LTGVSPEVHRAGKNPDKGSKSQKRVHGKRLEPMRDEVVTIAETLGDTNSHAIINNCYLTKQLGYHRGFKGYDLNPAANARGRRAGKVTDIAIDWLDEMTHESFFLLVHYFDPHLQYNPPPEFRRRFSKDKVGRIGRRFGDVGGIKSGRLKPTDDEKRQIKALYSDEIAYTDQEIGRLLKHLDRSGQGEDAWVFITADHGEELWDHGDFEHGHRFEDEVTRVPLIIRAPKRLRGQYKSRVAQSARMVDIHPTIIELFGKTPQKPVEGTSLMPLMKGEGESRSAFMQYVYRGPDAESYFDGRFKFIKYLKGDDYRLYDMKHDPKERSTIRDDSAKTNMADKLNAFKKMLESKFDSQRAHRSVTLSPETTEALRKLGYVDVDE
jgi:arylsulfatase A-like enzyme